MPAEDQKTQIETLAHIIRIANISLLSYYTSIEILIYFSAIPPLMATNNETKLKVGVLGATGAVGQNYVRLLENHPWFEISYLAASPQSAGKKYYEALGKKWLEGEVPNNLIDIVVADANHVEDAIEKCDFVFSAIDGEKDNIKALESKYAAAGFPVISNNSAHRWTPNVPMIIPEINSNHIDIIEAQQKHYGYKKGFVVVKPNCSIQSFLIQLYALKEAGYKPTKVIVTTEQASSGAGYPGVPSLDLIDNTVPYIGGEEEKTRNEPLKIFGYIMDGDIRNYNANRYEEMEISATCTRVPVIYGHTAVVNVGFKDKKPELEEILTIWKNFAAEPQWCKLPSAPDQPLIYRQEQDRPQPRRDRDNGIGMIKGYEYLAKGMAITTGRLEKCNVLDYRFVGFSHNTVRGAAGGAILTAELLKNKGYL
jgi:aspartate-semialdehyde dehydrogenase